MPHAPLLPIQDGCHAPAASPNANSFCARAGSVENVDAFAAENATTRSLAENWIDGDPLRDCVLARAIMEPAMAALRRQLFIGSERYERMMHGEGARRDNRVVGGARRLPYRMVVSARGDLDENFQRNMAIMFNSSILWRLLPETSLEEVTRCLTFRMGSMELAEYERLLSAPHKRPPFTTFLAWQVPQVAADLKASTRARPCLLDPFTAEFLEAFDIESTTGRKVLELILKMAFSDTVRQECWHAWV